MRASTIGTWFREHGGDRHRAHRSALGGARQRGLCAADAATRLRFARDLLNPTLASPSVNRFQKSDRDAADWLPGINRCWYAARVVEVRLKYALTSDERERDALERVLAGCESAAMVVDESGRQSATPTAPPTSTEDSPSSGANALRSTATAATAASRAPKRAATGLPPSRRGHPAYQYMDDRDNDGVVCE